MPLVDLLLALALRTLIPLIGITMLGYHLFELTPEYASTLGVLGAAGTLLVHRLT